MTVTVSNNDSEVIVSVKVTVTVQGFSIRAGSRRNSPATPDVFAAYFD